MSAKTRLKLALLYMKYRKYLWPALAVYFLWLRQRFTIFPVSSRRSIG